MTDLVTRADAVSEFVDKTNETIEGLANHTHANATVSSDGFMSKEDKSALDAIDTSELVDRQNHTGNDTLPFSFYDDDDGTVTNFSYTHGSGTLFSQETGNGGIKFAAGTYSISLGYDDFTSFILSPSGVTGFGNDATEVKRVDIGHDGTDGKLENTSGTFYISNSGSFSFGSGNDRTVLSRENSSNDVRLENTPNSASGDMYFETPGTVYIPGALSVGSATAGERITFSYDTVNKISAGVDLHLITSGDELAGYIGSTKVLSVTESVLENPNLTDITIKPKDRSTSGGGYSSGVYGGDANTSGNGGNLVLASGSNAGSQTDGSVSIKTGGSAGVTSVLVEPSGITLGPSGTKFKKILSNTATLDFGGSGVISSGTGQDLTITVTGAATGDSVSLGLPSVVDAGAVYNAWVSSTNTVTVRCSNISSGDISPASATYRVTVFNYT